jgi:hydrophobic/amphiphilic exporter-1 (mainly G- bacteria), HAE1 family
MSHKKDFNLAITNFFLRNSRLTIMSLLLLIVIGVYATMSLKTVGFPNPDVKLTIINTPYPGADANTVLKEVTEPIENAIANITGVDRYSSSSSDSFSSVVVNLETKAVKSEVDNKIKDAIDALTLPEESKKPLIVSPEISGYDVYLSLYQPDREKLFKDTTELTNYIKDLKETKEVTQENPFTQKVSVKLDQELLKQKGVSKEDVERAITTSKETIPVVTGVTVENQTQSIVTEINENLKYETLSELTIIPTQNQANFSKPPIESNPQAQQNSADQLPVELPVVIEPIKPATVLLKDVAKISLDYSFKNEGESLISIKDKNDKANVVEVVNIKIRTNANTDQIKYFDKIKEHVEKQSSLAYTAKNLPDTTKTVVVENYTQAMENQNQVSEVLSGLIGGELPVKNKVLAQTGWILGGIQLVFLVMIAFVSWRAAVIAAFSIPLSLMFTNIYLFAIGENLNTLVLFSFVLVIGLVVDPTLVILESIQRKLDLGLRGKAAARAAVKDVGLGLFLATLTNIIVFAPFAVVSGFFGQIISNIPLTIIPAAVGSYIVPLVFLAWFGSKFMKKNKNTTTSEVDNLWPVAQGLIKMNRKILHSHWVFRALIIIFGLMLSAGTTFYMFNSQKVKSVQFASGDNPEYIIVQQSFRSELSQKDRTEGQKELLKIIGDTKFVDKTFSSEELGLLASLEKDRTETARQISDKINKQLTKLDKYYLDVSTDVLSNGPPAESYQVVVAVKDKSQETIQAASKSIGNNLATICEVDKKYIINDCAGKESIVERVNDGYTGKTSKVLTYTLDKNKLNTNGLLSPQGPASIIVNQQLRSTFPQSANNEKLTTIPVNGVKEDLFVTYTGDDANSISNIDKAIIRGEDGKQTTLKDITKISKNSDTQSSISQINGEGVNLVQLRLKQGYNDQTTAAAVTQSITDYYKNDDYKKTRDMGLKAEAVGSYDDGGSAEFLKGFQDLFLALILAIVVSYFVLAIFFNSLSQPINILYTIPLTFIGVFPAVGFLSNGQFGFLEIIGLIILIGLVENVAIFLIDSANQLISTGNSLKESIVTASGLRMRPVILTNLTAIASLAPLAFLSETYRPLSLVIIFGLSSSGLVSLVTTPILFIFFKWLSAHIHHLKGIHRLLFVPFFPIYLILWSLDRDSIDLDKPNRNDDEDDIPPSNNPLLSEEKSEKFITEHGSSIAQAVPTAPTKSESKNNNFFEHRSILDHDKMSSILKD